MMWLNGSRLALHVCCCSIDTWRGYPIVLKHTKAAATLMYFLVFLCIALVCLSMQCGGLVLGAFVLVSIAVPVILPVFVPLAAIFYWVRCVCRTCSSIVMAALSMLVYRLPPKLGCAIEAEQSLHHPQRMPTC